MFLCFLLRNSYKLTICKGTDENDPQISRTVRIPRAFEDTTLVCPSRWTTGMMSNDAFEFTSPSNL